MDGGIVSFVPRAYQNEAVMFKLREPVERSELRKECEWVRTKMTLWLRSGKDAKQTCLAACNGQEYL